MAASNGAGCDYAAEVARDRDEVRPVHAHQCGQLAAGNGQRRARAFALEPRQADGRLGARDLGRRGGAGLDAALHQRHQLLERSGLALEKLDAPLRRQRLDEGDRRLGQQLQPCRLALPARGVVVAQGRLHARVALAAELDELAELQRRLRPLHGTALPGGEVVDLDAQRRVGQRIGLLAPAVGHADGAVGRGDPRIGVGGPLQGLRQGQGPCLLALRHDGWRPRNDARRAERPNGTKCH